MTSPRNIDLVIFDMDGVIFEGRNFWLDLHNAMGTEAEAWRLWHAYGERDYPYLANITVAQTWNGRDAGVFQDLVAARRYVDGAVDVVAWLRRHHIRTAIVSSGPYQLAERARDELGIDVIRANRVAFAGRVFAGTVDVQVDDSRKDTAALGVMAELGVTARRTVMVGDSASDARLAGVVGCLIAYDPDSDDLARRADKVIPAGRLRDLIDVLAAV